MAAEETLDIVESEVAQLKEAEKAMKKQAEKATRYFQKLERLTRNDPWFVKNAKVTDYGMVLVAALAASVFSNGTGNCIEKTYAPPEVVDGRASRIVGGMCRSYANGMIYFSESDCENAKLLCRTLVAYLERRGV